MTRCTWCGDDPLYVDYHDNEWGRPVTDADALFEKVCLEGFQSGLAWITILRKRENFRRAFNGFSIDAVVAMGDTAAHRDDAIARLMSDAGIVRHRGKIEATLDNARCAREMREQGIDLAAHIWSFALDEPFGWDATLQDVRDNEALPTTSPGATALSKDLRKRGWRFVGPTTMYSFMQSMGLVNDHVENCRARPECESARRATLSSLTR